jgi:hypothetical protein
MYWKARVPFLAVAEDFSLYSTASKLPLGTI